MNARQDILIDTSRREEISSFLPLTRKGWKYTKAQTICLIRYGASLINFRMWIQTYILKLPHSNGGQIFPYSRHCSLSVSIPEVRTRVYVQVTPKVTGAIWRNHYPSVFTADIADLQEVHFACVGFRERPWMNQDHLRKANLFCSRECVQIIFGGPPHIYLFMYVFSSGTLMAQRAILRGVVHLGVQRWWNSTKTV